MRKFSEEYTKIGKYWTLFGKGNIDGLAMFWDMMDICMKFWKLKWEVNQQEGREEFKCYMIWQIMVTMLHLNGQLRTERDKAMQKGCQSPAAQQKTTDLNWTRSKQLPKNWHHRYL